MMRCAVVSSHNAAKEIIFSLRLILKNHDWTYQYYEKLSAYAKDADRDYDIFILDASLSNRRVYDSLIQPHKEQIVIWLSSEPQKVHVQGRMFYVNINTCEKDCKLICSDVLKLLKLKEECFLHYNGIKVALRYSDIYYLEKINKNIVYHTKRGLFQERGSMSKKSEELSEYGFFRIHNSILVNMRYVLKIEMDEVFMANKEYLQIARARRHSVMKAYANSKKG